MSPRVSVLMPVFNSAETLPLALASLRAQTFEDWECVVVDDGSTDNPAEMIEAANDRRIRFFRLPRNMGRGYARQRTLEMARGAYIAMLDADDWIYPHKLERQTELMDADSGLAIVSSGMAITDRRGKLAGVRSPACSMPVLYASMNRLAMPPLAFGPCLMRSKLAKSTAFNPAFARAQDADFLLRALLGKRYAILCDPLYSYCEQECMPPTKVLTSLSYCCQMFRAYRGLHPVRARVLIAKTKVKRLVYLAAEAAGFWDEIIERRSRLPNPEEIQRHERAYQAVCLARVAVWDSCASGSVK